MSAATPRHNPADWPPEPGCFRLRLVRGGPRVAAQITHAMGFWAATMGNEACGARHPDPMHAAGVPEIWERGTRIDFAEYAELMTSLPDTPRLAIDVGALPPITFEDRTMSTATNVVPLHGRNTPTVDLATALEPAALAAWVDLRLATHIARGTALQEANKRFVIATAAGIANDDIAGKATDFRNQLKQAIDETDAERVRIKAPVLAAQRTIDGAAKTITDPLLAASKECEHRITAFLTAKDRAIRAAAAEEAARAREEAARLVDHAMATNEPDAIEQAATAETEQYTAEAIVQAPTPELTRLHTTNAGVASLRDNWVYEIADITKVPAHLLMINDPAVKALIRATPKGSTPSSPGLTFKNQPKVGIR